MKRALLSGLCLAFLLTWVHPATTEDAASALVGVWKYTDQSIKEVATGKITHPYGEKPTGHVVYTKGGHIVFVLAGDNRKPPASPNATDAERISLFNTIAAASGTYKVEGNTTLVTYEASWNQTWTGTTQKRQFEIKGNTLTVTSAPFKNEAGQDAIFIVTYERVE
jgi:lipocalin-like protein